jgi:adenosylmethionine-8-amino-7-oxononanoate aminotransferase
MESEGLVERAAAMGERLGSGLREALGDHPHVANIRHLGLMAGLTLVRDASSNTPYEASELMGGKVARDLREERGVITRFIGDHLVFAPPLVIEEGDVDYLVDATATAIQAVTAT